MANKKSHSCCDLPDVKHTTCMTPEQEEEYDMNMSKMFQELLGVITSHNSPTFHDFITGEKEPICSNPMGDCNRFYDKWKRGRPSKKMIERRKMYEYCRSKMKIKYTQRVIEP